MNEKAKKHFIECRAGNVTTYFNNLWDATDLVEEAIQTDLGILYNDPEGQEIYKTAFLRSMMYREVKLPPKIMKLVK